MKRYNIAVNLTTSVCMNNLSTTIYLTFLILCNIFERNENCYLQLWYVNIEENEKHSTKGGEQQCQGVNRETKTIAKIGVKK